MSDDLLNKKCLPCEGGVIPFDISEIHKYQENLNLNLYEIKYEDIINDFDNCIKQLLKFLNVNWTDDLKTYYLTASKRGIINTPSYNQVSSPLYKKSISRWKNYSENFLDINLKLEKWIKRYEY